MIRKLTLLCILSTIFCAGQLQPIFAISAAERSTQDYVMTLGVIREMQIMIDNFGTDDHKKKFDEVKLAFKKSAEKHYSQAFQRPPVLPEDAQPDSNAQYSTEMFYHLKIKMAELYDEVSKGYITRSRSILDSTSSQTNQVLVDYGRNTGMYKYFYRSIDPTTEKKPYKAENYHFYRDKETLERYLKNGYKALQDAENLYSNPDFAYLKAKKNKTPQDMDSILDVYTGIIRYCRQAKQFGLEIHKILKSSELGSIQRKYNITLGTINKYPIYDDRIPEDYKLDSVDNQRLVFAIEKERIGYQSPKSSQSAPAKEPQGK